MAANPTSRPASSMFRGDGVRSILDDEQANRVGYASLVGKVYGEHGPVIGVNGLSAGV